MKCHWVIVWGLFLGFSALGTGKSLETSKWVLDFAESFNQSDPLDSLKFEDKKFEGTWADLESWKGVLCNGYFGYQADVEGQVASLKADIQENETIDLSADLENVLGNFTGIYRSELSLCENLNVGHKIGVDRVSLKAVARLEAQAGGTPPKIKLKVLDTQLNHIRFYSVLPDWIEQRATKELNKGLKVLWRSWLGDWISDWVSKKFNEKFPGGGGGH